jgi:shikimate dehydrogenase
MTGEAIALIGSPVKDSISPAMHRAAFRAAGLDLEYVAEEVRAAELPEVFPRLRRSFMGLNVTRPLKEAILPFLDQFSPQAAEAGSVNTVEFTGDVAAGHSTDGPGFMAALARAGVGPFGSALILGTGGAARAVAFALVPEGTRVLVSGRNEEAGARLVSALRRRGPRSAAEFVSPDRVGGALADAELLVNATPRGGSSDPEAQPLPHEVRLTPELTVFDLVYRPRRTTLLKRAEAAGCRTVEGVEMLVEQGARSFSIWTGLPAPIEAMRVAGYDALEAPADALAEGRRGGR